MFGISDTVVIGGEISLNLDYYGDGSTSLSLTVDGDSNIVYVHRDADIYAGEYSVTPAVISQVLPTKDKLLVNNVTITKIPTYEVSNEYGNSFYIASSLEG